MFSVSIDGKVVVYDGGVQGFVHFLLEIIESDEVVGLDLEAVDEGQDFDATKRLSFVVGNDRRLNRLLLLGSKIGELSLAYGAHLMRRRTM